jgi:hypothetical protein
MGSPIRSEIWACTAPADPQLAAAHAWKDSALDHAGGEGMWGEMFWAAVESAAFVIEDPETLIRIGLEMIPLPCAISRVVREALRCWQSGLRWAEARERIADVFGHRQPCNAVPNHGFIILGWLYGEDFGEKLCTAVNCGYDTDCTGATLGSVLGIIGGTAAVPARWRDPVGESIVLHPFTGDCGAPADVRGLTERTVAVGRQAIADLSDSVALGDRSFLPPEALSLLSRNEIARAAWRRDVHAAVAVDGQVEITLHYGGEPVIYPGVARRLEVSVARGDQPIDAEVELTAPEGWDVRRAGGEAAAVFRVSAATPEPRNDVHVTVRKGATAAEADFRILGPQEARGYPAAENLPRCPECHGLKGYCLCTRG